jgi:hypothetical protein
VKTATYIRFAQFRAFWTARVFVRKVRFQILRLYYRAHHWVKDESQKTKLLLQFCYVTARQLIFAVLVGAIIWLTETVGNRLGWFSRWHPPDASNYVSFMGTVAQIGGVFIALYYTAVVSVAASVFAKAPSPVRNLLVGEQIGSFYMRFLAFTTFLPLILVAWTFFGVAPFHFGVPFIVVLAAVGVLMFVRLGQQAFNLFDPTSLALGAFDRFNRSLDEVSPSGFHWLDNTFQDHARRNGAEGLEAIAALYDICLNSPHLRGRPLQGLVNQTIFALSRYQVLKRSIPPRSYWFERIYSHPSLYLMPDYTLEISQRTGTTVQPELAFDSWWVEKRLEPLLIKYLGVSLQPQPQGSAIDLLEIIQNYLEQLVSQCQLEHAVELLETIGNEIAVGVTQRAKDHDSEYDFRLAALGEYYGNLVTSLLLRFSATTKSLTPESIRQAIERLDWLSESSVYLTRLPIFLTPRLEWLRERIQFEQSVEGRKTTPIWYQLELLSQATAEYLKKTLPILSGMLRRTSVLPADFAPDGHQVWFAAGLLRTRWEFLKKVPYHLGVISESVEPFKRPVILSDLPWPTIDMREHLASMEIAESEAVVAMAKIIALMVGKSRPENLPDYRGQFLQNLAEGSLSALSKDDGELLKKIFPVFFVGSMAEVEALRPEPSTDYTFVAKYQVALAPIFDLIEISGQALAFAELRGNPALWETVKSTWDRYLDSMPNGIKQLSLIVTHGKPQFAIPPRGIIRTAWSQALSHSLMEIPGASDGMFHSSKADKVQHGSPLIRYLASRAHLFDEIGSQVFLSLYLRKRPGADGVEWPRERDLHLSRVFTPSSERVDDDEDED